MTRRSPAAHRRCVRVVMVAALVLATVIVTPRPVAAEDDDEFPAGKFGLVGGARQGIGSLGDSFGWGGLWGVQAGYHPGSIGRYWSFGVEWSVLWGWFGADQPAVSDGNLNLLEMNFGVRIRRLMGPSVPRYLVLSGGGTLLRTNVPVKANDDRQYVGPYAGIGVEQYVRGKTLVSLEWRYGMFSSGPGSFSMLVSLSFGSN